LKSVTEATVTNREDAAAGIRDNRGRNVCHAARASILSAYDLPPEGTAASLSSTARNCGEAGLKEMVSDQCVVTP
jgi:hypothetical protein